MYVCMTVILCMYKIRDCEHKKIGSGKYESIYMYTQVYRNHTIFVKLLLFLFLEYHIFKIYHFLSVYSTIIR